MRGGREEERMEGGGRGRKMKMGTKPKYLPPRNTKRQSLHFYSKTINSCSFFIRMNGLMRLNQQDCSTSCAACATCSSCLLGQSDNSAISLERGVSKSNYPIQTPDIELQVCVCVRTRVCVCVCMCVCVLRVNGARKFCLEKQSGELGCRHHSTLCSSTKL